MDRPYMSTGGKGIYIVFCVPPESFFSVGLLTIAPVVVLCPASPETFENTIQNVEHTEYDEYRNEIFHYAILLKVNTIVSICKYNHFLPNNQI